MRYFIFILCVAFGSCLQNKISNDKINGVSFVASDKKITQQNINPIIHINANFAAIMPFAVIKKLSHPTVVYDPNRQWFGETPTGVTQYIIALKKNHIKIMLKPQLWVWNGEFTGNIKMTSEKDWLELEQTYEDFILTHAKIAQDNQVEIYCIGTELEQFVKHRPLFWNALIQKIRRIYKGKLTYAANWDEYLKTPFWAALDYIGIDGYFPLSEEKTPMIQTLKIGWQKHKIKMKKHSDSLNKKILFTEFGYRSVDYAAAKPWEIDYNKTAVNLKGQVNTTRVLFEELWNEDWFAGGFVWKWFIDYKNSGGKNDPRFTPQNKPAEDVIREYYLQYE